MRIRKTVLFSVSLTVSFSIFPSVLISQTSDELQEGWNRANDSIQQAADEQSYRANEYANNVDMFVVDDVSVASSDMYKTVNDSRPSEGKVVQVYMGDKMIVQRTGYFADCIIPKFETSQSKMGGWEYFIKANTPICKTEKNDKKYMPAYVNGIRNGGEGTTINPVSVKENRDGTFKVCQSGLGMSWACKKDATKDEISIGPAFVSAKDGLQRTIEYAGKSGNQIKFIYSEFVHDMARDAFTREFEVDLSDGNVAAYKGAVFEILEVNNAQITYKVIRHFQ